MGEAGDSRGNLARSEREQVNRAVGRDGSDLVVTRHGRVDPVHVTEPAGHLTPLPDAGRVHLDPVRKPDVELTCRACEVAPGSGAGLDPGEELAGEDVRPVRPNLGEPA